MRPLALPRHRLSWGARILIQYLHCVSERLPRDKMEERNGWNHTKGNLSILILGPAAKSTLQIPNLDSNKQQNQTDQETTKKRACWGSWARKFLLFQRQSKRRPWRWARVDGVICRSLLDNYESQLQIMQLEIPLVKRTLGKTNDSN